MQSHIERCIRVGYLHVPVPHMWDTSSHQEGWRGEEGRDRRCGNWRHIRHTVGVSRRNHHYHTPHTSPPLLGEAERGREERGRGGGREERGERGEGGRRGGGERGKGEGRERGEGGERRGERRGGRGEGEWGVRGREERGRGEERGEGRRGDGEGGGKSTHNIMSSKCISGGLALGCHMFSPQNIVTRQTLYIQCTKWTP